MNKAQSQPGTSAFSFQMYRYYKASIAKGTREDSETVTGVLLYRGAFVQDSSFVWGLRSEQMNVPSES